MQHPSSLHGLDRFFLKNGKKIFPYSISPRLGTCRSLRSRSPSPPWTARRRPPGPAGASGSTLCTRVHKRQFAMCIEGSTIQVLYTFCVQQKDFFLRKWSKYVYKCFVIGILLHPIFITQGLQPPWRSFFGARGEGRRRHREEKCEGQSDLHCDNFFAVSTFSFLSAAKPRPWNSHVVVVVVLIGGTTLIFDFFSRY